MNQKQLKSSLLLVLLLWMGSTALAASAVAVNKATGAYGYAYGKASTDAAKKAALEACDGTCEVIAVSDKDGHGAVLRNVNNWKTEGQEITTYALLSKPDPIAIRTPGTGEHPDCLILDIWYDNSTAAEGQKYEGAGGRRAPEVNKPDGENQRNGYVRDLKIIDGREIRHGHSRKYYDKEKRTGLQTQYEFYNDLSDGPKYTWKIEEGEDPVLEYEWMFKDGWRHGYSRQIGPLGSVRKYQEYREDKKAGWMYEYNLQGKLEEVGHWANDKRHGPWRAYDVKTGHLKYTGFYKKGKKDGLWITYDYKTGAERKRQNYVNGVLMD